MVFCEGVLLMDVIDCEKIVEGCSVVVWMDWFRMWVEEEWRVVMVMVLLF